MTIKRKLLAVITLCAFLLPLAGVGLSRMITSGADRAKPEAREQEHNEFKELIAAQKQARSAASYYCDEQEYDKCEESARELIRLASEHSPNEAVPIGPLDAANGTVLLAWAHIGQTRYGEAEEILWSALRSLPPHAGRRAADDFVEELLLEAMLALAQVYQDEGYTSEAQALVTKLTELSERAIEAGISTEYYEEIIEHAEDTLSSEPVEPEP